MMRCDFSLQHLIPSRDGEEKIDFGRGMQFVSCDSEKWCQVISESNTEVFLEPILLQQVVWLSVDRVQDSNHRSALISWKVLLLLLFFYRNSLSLIYLYNGTHWPWFFTFSLWKFNKMTQMMMMMMIMLMMMI